MSNERSDEVVSFKIHQDDLDHFKRLDAWLAAKIPDLSRSLIKKLFEQGSVSTTSDCKLELKRMPPLGTVVNLEVPPPRDVEIIPQNIPLEILFEDEHLLIINKAAGMVVHPAPGNYDGTLVNAILYHCRDLKGIGNEKRPGIVHRLDKGTSGIMVIAKSQMCHEKLVEIFQAHAIERFYEAIVLGVRIPPAQTLESTIGRSPHNRLKMAANVKNGKNALTHMKVLEFFNHFSHVELKLETGRTHQIRVHLSDLLNCPILNDPLYGRPKDESHFLTSELKSLLKDYDYPLLHAKILGFEHPITQEKMYFEKGPPDIFQRVLKSLKSVQ